MARDQADDAAEPFLLTEEFLRAIRRWEDAPQNQNGQDKTWSGSPRNSVIITAALFASGDCR